MTAPRPYRLLVTGARDLADELPVHEAIDDVYVHVAAPLLVVHGSCPTGADHHVVTLVERLRAAGHLDIDHEPHPADWDHCAPGCPPTAHRIRKRPGDVHHPGELPDYCPGAGPRRNARMISLGADHVLAFPRSGRRRSGTRATIRLAREAGIPVTVIVPPLETP